MSALARWCYRHRFVVITAWIGLLIGLAVMSQAVKASYDNSFTLPGSGSGIAQELLMRSAPAQAGDSDQIVWQVSHGSVKDSVVKQRMSAMLAQVSRLPEVASVASPYLPGGEVQVSLDGRTAYATVNFTQTADYLNNADVNRVIAVATAAREPGLAVELGGKAISDTGQAPLSTITAIGIVAAAIILLFAFGSLFAMALPIATAVAGVGSGMMLMAPLSHLMSVTGIAPILGALIGLGVGVDYALFIVTRYRRGLQSGLDLERSAVLALNTSGRAVLFAGGTVCIALLGLFTLGQGLLDGLAVAAAITVACAVLAAVTLLPALFGVLGLLVLSRTQLRRLRAEGPDHAESGSGMWARWSRTVPRFPAVLAAAGLAVMLVVSAPVLHLRLGFADASNDPTSSTTYAFFQWGWGTRAFGLGAPSPIEGYLPGLVLAILFGLSMDYQVFLVSRMAEEWSHTRDNARSVLVGQTHTARVITAAAAIMIAVFIAFVFMGQVDIAEFGIGLAAAVALDAFVLRTVLVPAVMHLCGRANWWLPRWLDRRLPHLAIEPPAREQSARAPQSALV